ncbi:Heat shock protein. Metallo peptidase. MEROPS family M48B [Seinonella peptonophila]|uniref:Protease HtpX homolog n=1 Tax=Seinonella peptonophila TaxID=112248 RepID=A0A1M4Z6X1_9BACL|nr:zinc metalloprotease HtpX [Seinonella peptonophila]SHF13760.1 Heat shock protein. Metallo peptidase. MEROPS family M48B [Seinonella peptonophila]
MPFKQQIQTNKQKTILLVAIFIAFVLFIGSTITYLRSENWVSGFIIACVIGLIYTGIMIASSTRMVMAMNHATEIDHPEQHPYLWQMIQRLANRAEIPMPKIYIIEDNSPNAFATGLSPQKGAVAMTTGLLHLLDQDEVEGVLAHEIAHIKNYDVRLATIAISLVSAVALLSNLGSQFLIFSGGHRDDERQNPLTLIISLLMLFLAPLIATYIRLAISRNREYLADASGAALCQNPLALASALRKISGIPIPVQAANPSSASLYFADPLKKQLAALFSTHPPVEERVARLEALYHNR